MRLFKITSRASALTTAPFIPPSLQRGSATTALLAQRRFSTLFHCAESELNQWVGGDSSCGIENYQEELLHAYNDIRSHLRGEYRASPLSKKFVVMAKYFDRRMRLGIHFVHTILRAQVQIALTQLAPRYQCDEIIDCLGIFRLMGYSHKTHEAATGSFSTDIDLNLIIHSPHQGAIISQAVFKVLTEDCKTFLKFKVPIDTNQSFTVRTVEDVRLRMQHRGDDLFYMMLQGQYRHISGKAERVHDLFAMIDPEAIFYRWLQAGAAHSGPSKPKGLAPISGGTFQSALSKKMATTEFRQKVELWLKAKASYEFLLGAHPQPGQKTILSLASADIPKDTFHIKQNLVRLWDFANYSHGFSEDEPILHYIRKIGLFGLWLLCEMDLLRDSREELASYSVMTPGNFKMLCETNPLFSEQLHQMLFTRNGFDRPLAHPEVLGPVHSALTAIELIGRSDAILCPEDPETVKADFKKHMAADNFSEAGRVAFNFLYQQSQSLVRHIQTRLDAQLEGLLSEVADVTE